MIICLCGSTRHKEDFLKLAAALALEGYIVLMPHVFSHYDKISLTKAQKTRLELLGQKQVKEADHIIVVTGKDGHIGKDTYLEICHANKQKVPVHYANSKQIDEYVKKKSDIHS